MKIEWRCWGGLGSIFFRLFHFVMLIFIVISLSPSPIRHGKGRGGAALRTYFPNMALLHHNSPECSMTKSDVFAVPPTQLSVEQSQYTEILPVSTLIEAGLVKFFIPLISAALSLSCDQKALTRTAKTWPPMPLWRSSTTTSTPSSPRWTWPSEMGSSLSPALFSPTELWMKSWWICWNDLLKSQFSVGMFYKDRDSIIVAQDSPNQGPVHGSTKQPAATSGNLRLEIKGSLTSYGNSARTRFHSRNQQQVTVDHY